MAAVTRASRNRSAVVEGQTSVSQRKLQIDPSLSTLG